MTRLRFMMLAVCVSFFAFSSIHAQDYSSAIGARLGSPLSASYKMFINDNGHAVEGIAGFRSYSGYSWVTVGAAYQLHNDISSVDGLYWYYGAGVSAFFWSFNNDFIAGADQSSLSLGLQGYLGLDYTFAGAPVNVSVDWVPTVFIGGFGSGFGAGYGALAVRYVLN